MVPARAATTQPTMAAEPIRTVVEADDVLELEPDELPEVCEALEAEVELDAAELLDWLTEVAMLELAEDEADDAEAEAEAEALEPEAEADDEDEPDEAAAEVADTIRPLPQGIAGPSGCLAKGGAVVAPLASAMAKRVVQVGSAPPCVNWKK